MERCCSTGQSPQRAVAPTEKEEEVLASPNIQINQPTRYIFLSALLPVVQIELNMFRVSLCPSSGAYQLQ
jgi:hypothetical protein